MPAKGARTLAAARKVVAALRRKGHKVDSPYYSKRAKKWSVYHYRR